MNDLTKQEYKKPEVIELSAPLGTAGMGIGPGNSIKMSIGNESDNGMSSVS